MGALARLARQVTETPWGVARPAELSDEETLHAIALSAFFGHLNRIADVVGVPLDYEVQLPVPAVDPSVPALAPAPRVADGPPRLDLASRPATAAAIATWKARLGHPEIQRWVAGWLGAAPPADGSGPLHDLARTVTLAPWQLSDFAPLRALGLTDAAIFDAAATASAAGMFSRIDVALRSLR